ncbi:MAG: hypothetical protein SNJ84_10830, partial [Verrucomicrobiia bacterium]
RFIGATLYPPGVPVAAREEVLGVYAVSPDGRSAIGVGPEEAETRGREESLVVLHWDQDRNRLWTAGFTLVDLVRPGTTDLFLRTTHARYAERFRNDFGGVIRYAFADEPSLATTGLHASHHFLTEFRRDHGYSLEGHLEAFLVVGEAAGGVRYDYFETLQRLWITHFLRPMHDWCEANGLEFTGHFNEHHWPNMAGQPNNMVSQRWMHAPGTDLLGFQFRPEEPGANGLFFLNLKECRSVANQLGRERILCETTGGGGYDMGVDGFKRLTDYALALGVNLVNPHLSHQTLAGARKYDWPHTLSDHSPWWGSYRMQADHDARVSAALSAGAEQNRVLVFQPTGSAWMYSLPTQFGGGAAGAAAAAWRKAALRSQTALLEDLYFSQVDFDLGDEWILEELGSVEGQELRIGQARYRCVVVPPMMETIRPETLALLERWIEAGGRVHLYGAGPERLDGRRPGPGDERLVKAIGQWIHHSSLEALVAAVRADVPPRFSAPGGGSLPKGLVWAWRGLDDGSNLLFIANPWQAMLEGEIEVEGGRVTNMETFTGRLGELPARPVDGKLRLPFRMGPSLHHLWWIRPEASSSLIDIREWPRWGVELQEIGVSRDEPNVCVIDYCDLELPTRRFAGINTTRADRICWQEHGFPHNPWNVSIQFKKVFLEHPFGADSGFAVTYRFQVGDLHEAMAGLEIAFERPWLYRATLNGREFPTVAGRRWWDENVRAFPIGQLVHPGENILRLEIKPMHPLAEIMPVYVLGDFALVPVSAGFRLEPSRPLTGKAWAEEGLPFYCRGVTHRYQFTTDRPGREILVKPGSWNGSAVSVTVDGHPMLRLSHTGFVVRIPCDLAA